MVSEIGGILAPHRQPAFQSPLQVKTIKKQEAALKAKDITIEKKDRTIKKKDRTIKDLKKKTIVSRKQPPRAMTSPGNHCLGF